MAEATRPTTATVIFTDVVGSSALRARLGEERADELRSIHDGLLAARVSANGGRVLRHTGDGLVAAFLAACDGLTAAIEMQQAVAAYNRRVGALAVLSIRIGLSTGDVSWSGGDCFGTPMVEAARLEVAAEGGQILCSEYVRMMARGRGGHEFRRMGYLELKGLPEPLAVSEVLWSPGSEPGGIALPSELAAASGPFVSRSSELREAEEVLTDGGRNRLTVLWLLGEPGIGKTRLGTEIARRAHAGGSLVLFGRCGEDLAVPYQPFVEALRWFLVHVPDGQLRSRLGAFAGELTRLVPELAHRVPGLEPTRSASPAAEQHRLFEAVRCWLAAAGADRPVVAVLDDVHWADRPTLALLGHIARSAEPSSAVLVCTARTTSPDDNPVLAALADELERRDAPSRRMELTGLAVDDVSELVSLATGRDLDDRMRAMAAELQAETAGNPLFVESLLSTLPADIGRTFEELPRSLAETVSRRVRRLPDAVVGLLHVASVAGLEFDLRVTAQAAARDEMQTLEALEGACRAGLIEETAVNRYRFTHALIRSVLRDELGRSRRVRVHLAVGDAIETLCGDDLDENIPALAHHFFEAVPVGGAQRAYRYAVIAAERATRLLSHREAAEAYGRALELIDLLQVASSPVRSELLIARGEAQSRAGDVRSSLETLQAAADAASGDTAAEHLARAALAYETAGALTGSPGAAAVELLRRAEAALPHEDTRLRALTLASLSRALEFAGRQTEAIERAEEALAMSRRLRDEGIIGTALLRTSFPYMAVEHAHLMATRCEELMALAQRLHDDEFRIWAVSFGLLSFGQLGDLPRLDELLVELARQAEQLHQPIWRHDLALIRHVRAAMGGDLELAERELEAAAELDEQFGWGLEGVYALAMFLLRREQGRLEGLVPMVRMLVRTNPETSVWRPGLAALYAALGMLDEARAEFDRLASDCFATFPSDHNRTLLLSLLAEVCCALGDVDRAAWFLDQLRPCQGRVLLWQQACLGPADRILGMLASVASRSAEADGWHARALELSRRLRSPLWTAHCLSDYADHVWPGDPDRAQSMRDEATTLCERHHLAGLRRRLAATTR